MKITDEMVKAARDAYQRAYPGGIVGARNIQMRAALQAVADHLEGATPGSCICGTYLDRDGDPQKDADDPSCPVHGEGATPAIDREALRGKLDQLWGWAKSGERRDLEGGEYYLMAKENVDAFTANVLALIGGAS